MATTDRATVALNELEVTIGSILMQTGSAFTEATQADIVRMSRTSTRVRQFAPKAVSTLNDHLDVLELQIQNAQRQLRLGLAAQKAAASGIHPVNQTTAAFDTTPVATQTEEKASEDMAAQRPDVEDTFMDDDLFESPVDAPKPELGAQVEGALGADAQAVPDKSMEQEKQQTEEAYKQDTDGTTQVVKQEASKTDPDQAEIEQKQKAEEVVTGEGGSSEAAAGDEKKEPNKDEATQNESTFEAMDLSNDDNNLLSGIEDYANDSGMAGFEGMSSFEDLNTSNLNGEDDLLNGAWGTEFTEGFQNNSEFENLFGLDNLGESKGEGQTNFEDINFDDNFFNLDGS